jgi:ferredoxin-NADP reductase
MTLVVSARSPHELYYADELTGPRVRVVYTRTAPPGDARGVGRLTGDDLRPVVTVGQPVFVCGSPAFCDAVTMLLDSLGVPAHDIRVERFGPSG